MWSRAGVVGSVVVGFLMAGCSGGGDNGGTGPTPSFTMTVSPTSLSLDVPAPFVAEGATLEGNAAIEAAAATGNLTVNITRAGGFEGAVTATVEGLPNGVTAPSATIAAGATSALIALTAGATATAGNANVTVRGTGTGVTARTATVALTVVGSPGMSIALQQNALSIGQGNTGNTSVNITRTGSFTGAVNLTSTGAPAGMTVAFNPQSATGASSAITVTVGSAVPAASYPITIQGSGTGVPSVSATLTVTVTQPSISLSLSAAAIAIQQGTSGSPGLTITRTNFTGAVTLTSSGAPAGMTVSFNPASTTGTSSVVTVAVGAGVAAGNHDVTISGTGQGIAQANVVLTITVIAAPTGIVTLSLSPTAVSLDAGTNTNVGLTINRTNFAGTVNLTATGVPANMTVTFNPASTTGNASTITVAPGEDLAGGIYQVTVRANGTNLAEATAILTVTVTVPPMFVSLNLVPSALSIQQGQNGNTTVNVTRTNYPGTVNLTATGAPAGMTVGFNPASTTANSSTITVTVGGGVAVGSYPIIIRANGAGLSEASAQLTVTVTASGGGGSNVTMTFCAQTGQPQWLAYQSFGGSWTQVTGVGGVFNFNITTKGAVAWVMPDGATQYTLSVVYGSVADLNLRGSSQCVGSGGTKTVNGTATGVGALGLGTFSMGGGSATVFGTDGPFQIQRVRDGLQDLLATRMSFVTGEIDRIFLARGLNIANGGSVGTVDLGSALTPVTRTATFGNRGTDQVGMSALFMTSNGTAGNVAGIAPVAANTQTWTAVPDVNTVAGDFHMQSAVATASGNMTGFPYRSVSQFNRLSADRTYNLPAYIGTPPTANVTGTAPYVTINSSWTVQSADFDDFWTMIYNPVSGSVTSVTIQGTAGYFGAGPVTLNLPTFGAGFNPLWGLQPGVQTQWTFIANGGSAWGIGTGAQGFEGAVSNSAGVTGVITP